MSGLKIGQVAKQSGLSVEAIRYYEQRGLLPAPQRSPAGYRLYGPTTLARLQFIQRAKGLGFSLEEVSELLALQLQPGRERSAVKSLVEEKVALVQRKLDELLQLQAQLQRLSSCCDGQGLVADCPIIHFLQDGEAGAE